MKEDTAPSGFTAEEKSALDAIERAASGDSLEIAASASFKELGRIMPCDRLDIGIAEEGGSRVTLRHVMAGYGPLAVLAGFTGDVAGGPYQRALTTGEVDMAALAPGPGNGAMDELGPLLAGEGIRSIVVAPILCGTAIGIVSCASRSAGAYHEGHASILAAAARHLRNPIERAYHAEQIERSHQAYMEMLGFVAHELKSPLASIITQVRTMAEGYYGKLEDRQREVLARVVKKAEYLHAMTGQYLNLSHFESRDLKLRPKLVDFAEDVIEPVLEILHPQIEERAVKVERGFGESVFPVRCDPDLMKIVMINLAGNGIKYGNRGGVLRVTLGRSFGTYEVAVWNEGPGFSEDERHRLFKKFSRLQAAELIERKGSGIGLYVSWRIVHLHGGRIHAESEPGSWARFTVDLPRYPDRS